MVGNYPDSQGHFHELKDRSGLSLDAKNPGESPQWLHRT